MTKTTLADTLSLIAERAPALRAAGVRVVDVENVHFELDPPEPPEPKLLPDADQDEDEVAPLDDPMTYGRRKTVPRRHDFEDDD